MPKELPTYFREYLDERFAHVVSKIIETGKDINCIADEIKKLNGSVLDLHLRVNKIDYSANQNLRLYVPQFREVRKKVNHHQRYIICLLVAILLLGLLFLKETNNPVLAFVISLFSGL